MRALLVAIALASSVAHAAPPKKRPVPAYDGRGDTPTTAGDVARATLRVVLFPIRIVVDYGLRWPIGKVITAAEHSRKVRGAIDYLFLQPAAPSPSVMPIAFYDFGFQSSIGIRAQWTYGFLTKGSKFSVKIGTGGLDWWRGDFAFLLAVPRTRGFRVATDISVRRRPDQQFFGIGPLTEHAARARYLHARFGSQITAGWREFSLFAGVAATFTAESHFNNAPSIEDQVAAGKIGALPGGYNDLVGTERYGARIALDTRGTKDSAERDRNSSGARIDALVEKVHAHAIGDWLHLDATVGGALRLDRVGEHKLDLRMRVELVEPNTRLDPAAIPFYELATIGGSRDLRGFASGRGRDLSATALMLDYQWPLAAWLDATMYLGAGNVFGRGLSGFTAGKLRASFGMGLALAGLSNDRQLELWAAVGTDPFDNGADVNSFRLVLGYSYDY